MKTATDLRQEIRESLELLPAFPRVITDILSALDDESASMALLAEHIKHGPVLTGRILSAAARGGQPRELPEDSGVFEAVMFLGVEKTREVAIAASMGNFNHQLGRKRHHVEHGLAVGICAQELGMRHGVSPEHAMLAGLLHDLGYIWLTFAYPQRNGLAGAMAEMDLEFRLQTEKKLFGLDHAEIGEVIARTWQLPEDICQAIARHHDLTAPLDRPLTAVIQLAETIVTCLDLTPFPDSMVTGVSPEAVAALDFDWQEEAQDLFGRVEARFKHARSRWLLPSEQDQ